jgi:putative transcriptional regulator
MYKLVDIKYKKYYIPSVMPRALISNQIRRLRFEHGEMTQQALADEVGCTRQTIVLLEQSRYAPSLALAFRIARVFDARIEDVFQFTE